MDLEVSHGSRLCWLWVIACLAAPVFAPPVEKPSPSPARPLPLLLGPRHRRGPLTRPRAGRKLAGVCQGLANQYSWDVTLTRVIAVLLAVLVFPVGLLAYGLVLGDGARGAARPLLRM